jgi:hypothetical protein
MANSADPHEQSIGEVTAHSGTPSQIREVQNNEIHNKQFHFLRISFSLSQSATFSRAVPQ